MNQVSIRVPRHSRLLLYSFVASVALTVINGHSIQALAGVDTQGLVHNLQSGNVGNLVKQQKAERPSNAKEKIDNPDSKASSAQAGSSRPVAASVSVPAQLITDDLAPLPTIDTPILPYSYSSIPQGRLVQSKTMASAVAIDKPSSPVLAASSQGWKVAGLAWYWWLTALGLAAVAGRWVLYRHKTLARVR